MFDEIVYRRRSMIKSRTCRQYLGTGVGESTRASSTENESSQEAVRDGRRLQRRALKGGQQRAEQVVGIGHRHRRHPVLHAKVGEAVDADRTLRQRIGGMDPEMDEAWFGIGVILDAQGKWYEAVHFFKKAVELYDDSADYWVALAAAEYNVGHVVSALESYARAAEIQPEDKDIYLNWSQVLNLKKVREAASAAFITGPSRTSDIAQSRLAIRAPSEGMLNWADIPSPFQRWVTTSQKWGRGLTRRGGGEVDRG